MKALGPSLSLSFALLLAVPAESSAQQLKESVARIGVPPVISFNGTARDRSGQPLGGMIGVTFSLYRDQEGGVPLWTENQNVQLETQGRYAVLLGATQGGVPLDLFTSSEPRWLGVRLQTISEEEQPRVLLVSVPYALKAADADTIGGKPASAFVLAQPRGSSLDDETPMKSAISGLDAAGVFAASGTGSMNKLVKWTDNSGALGDSVLTESGGKIGLSNDSPTVSLDVSGTIRSILHPTAPFGTYLLPTFGAANDFRFGFGNNFFFDGTNWRTKGDTVNNAGSALLTDIVNGAMSIYSLPSTGGEDQVIPNGSLQNFEKMRIRGDGRVGIGNANPTTTLDVTGTIRAVHAPGSPFGTYLMPNGGLPNGFRFGLGNNLYFDGANWRTKGDGVNNAGSALLTDIATGQLSVFTMPSTGPADQVVTNAGFAAFEKLRITQFGDLGIGTTVPQAKLDVAGNMKANGTVSGSQLVSNVTTGTPPLVVSSTTQVPNLNASMLGGQPASSYMLATPAALIRGITYLGGCETCSPLTNADDQPTIYFNVVGPMTISEVTCFSDMGAPTINIQRNDGTPANILSSDLPCSTAGTTSSTFVAGESALSLGHKLDFVMVNAGGVAKRVTVAIKAVLN